MLKKVYSTFLTLLILFSVLTGCVRRIPPMDSPPPQIVRNSPTPAASTNPPISSLITDIPNPEKEISLTYTPEVIVTQEVFTTLSSPDLKGRAMGSSGSKKAQTIIIDLFSDMNLTPFNEEFKSSIFTNQSLHADSSGNFEGHNVIGLLLGKNSEECLVISAHYDGADNETAALDNAAGVYALLKTAEKLSFTSETRELSRDIVFAALDGEEFGLIGSGSLVDQIKNRYKKTVVINLDCVGIKGNDSYMVIGDPLQFEPLIDSLYQQLKTYHFTTVPVNGVFGSDHLPFEWQGIPAVTIGERDVEGIVHTVSDVADKVDLDEIERLSEAVYNYVTEQVDALYEILYP